MNTLLKTGGKAIRLGKVEGSRKRARPNPALSLEGQICQPVCHHGDTKHAREKVKSQLTDDVE